jgi:hypothetical protein
VEGQETCNEGDAHVMLAISLEIWRTPVPQCRRVNASIANRPIRPMIAVVASGSCGAVGPVCTATPTFFVVGPEVGRPTHREDGCAVLVQHHPPNMAPQSKTDRSFGALTPALSEWILEAVDAMGFVKTTPVQHAAIPMFMKNSDVVVEAVTGSGKTLA